MEENLKIQKLFLNLLYLNYKNDKYLEEVV